MSAGRDSSPARVRCRLSTLRLGDGRDHARVQIPTCGEMASGAQGCRGHSVRPACSDAPANRILRDHSGVLSRRQCRSGTFRVGGHGHGVDGHGRGACHPPRRRRDGCRRGPRHRPSGGRPSAGWRSGRMRPGGRWAPAAPPTNDCRIGGRAGAAGGAAPGAAPFGCDRHLLGCWARGRRVAALAHGRGHRYRYRARSGRLRGGSAPPRDLIDRSPHPDAPRLRPRRRCRRPPKPHRRCGGLVSRIHGSCGLGLPRRRGVAGRTGGGGPDCVDRKLPTSRAVADPSLCSRQRRFSGDVGRGRSHHCPAAWRHRSGSSERVAPTAARRADGAPPRLGHHRRRMAGCDSGPSGGAQLRRQHIRAPCCRDPRHSRTQWHHGPCDGGRRRRDSPWRAAARRRRSRR